MSRHSGRTRLARRLEAAGIVRRTGGATPGGQSYAAAEREARIAALLADGQERTTREIADAIGVDPRTMRGALRSMCRVGLVEHMGRLPGRRDAVWRARRDDE